MSLNKNISIIKADGTRVQYDPEKLLTALHNSGADRNQSLEIVRRVEQKLYDGIPSRKIYQLAYSLLRQKKAHRVAGRYRLKKAIFELGPSGYPFEHFVGKLFESFGYQVKTGQHIRGKCVEHEVDVVAIKPGEQVIVECKFHSDYRARTNVQVPLYINSRFKDIKEKWAEENRFSDMNVKGFVVTNARFTKDAIAYAECAGLGLISWDYPKDSSLKYFTDKAGLHPLTALHTLNKGQKRELLGEGIVLCRELTKNENLLRKQGLTEKQIHRVLDEVRYLTAQ
jgi:hypothetical protein